MPDSARIVRSFTEHAASCTVALSSDASRIAIAPTDARPFTGKIRILKVSSGELLAELPTGLREFRAVAFDPNDKFVLVTGINNDNADTPKAAEVFNAATGRLLWRLNFSSRPFCSFSPDGLSVLITDTNTNSARVCEASTGTQRWLNSPPESARKHVNTATWSSDGTKVAICINPLPQRTPTDIDIVNAGTGDLIKRIRREGRVETVRWSPGSSLLGFGSGDVVGTIDTTTGLARVLPLPEGSSVHFGGGVFFSPDGRLLGCRYGRSGESDGVRVFRTDTMELLYEKTGPGITSFNFEFLSFSQDSRTVLLPGANNRTVQVLNSATGETELDLKPPDHASRVDVISAAFGAGGRFVAVGTSSSGVAIDGDSTATVFERPVVELFRFRHDGPVSAVAFNANGTRLLTGSADKTARLFDPVTGGELNRRGHDAAVVSVGFVSGTALFATASKDKTARIFDPTGTDEIARITHSAALTALAVSPDGTRVATADEDGQVRITAVGATTPSRNLSHFATVTALEFSPDGTRLATACNDSAARIFNADTGTQLFAFGQAGPINAVVFNHDGTQLATAGADRTARTYDTVNGDERLKVDHGAVVHAVAFNPNGTLLATADANNTARLLTIGAATSPRILPHDGPVTALAFGADGAVLATASADNTARIWRTTTGEQLRKFPHDKPVNAVAINATLLATASADNTARIWRLPT